MRNMTGEAPHCDSCCINGESEEDGLDGWIWI